MAELTDGTAELRVLVTTALGALPLENAIVSVSTARMIPACARCFTRSRPTPAA